MKIVVSLSLDPATSPTPVELTSETDRLLADLNAQVQSAAKAVEETPRAASTVGNNLMP